MWVRLALLLAYLASPIDLMPDFIPVVDYADDAIIVAAMLRSVARHAGVQALKRHWPGTRDGFAALRLPHRAAASPSGQQSRQPRPDGREPVSQRARRRPPGRAAYQVSSISSSVPSSSTSNSTFRLT